MPKALNSSHVYYATNVEVDRDRRLFAHIPLEMQRAEQPERKIPESTRAIHASESQGSELLALGHDKEVAELAIRQLTTQIDHAKEELRELEETFLQELLKPPARRWLFPLMAVGLALSLYGSLAAVSAAAMVATGLMLLWSLGAFWLIYSGDKLEEKSRNAHKAEIEIWSSRIAELQQSLDRNRRIIETAG